MREEDGLRIGLEKLARLRYGASAEISPLSPGDGHAGQTWLFDINSVSAGVIGAVLKLAPRGVRPSGVADVYAQAALLERLHGAGLPVPQLLFAAPDAEALGAPFIVMGRLPGRTYQSWDPHPDWPRDTRTAALAWTQAAQTLPLFHRIGWKPLLRSQERPDTPRELALAWRRTYQKSPEPRWIAQAEKLEARLLATTPDPASSPIGLVHGDYQPGNVVYHQGTVSGVIDWDLARIGPVLLDLGWLMMMSDKTAWSSAFGAPDAPPAEVLCEIYERGAAEHPALPWYRALAGFRMGAIACLNVYLHRSGKRPDPLWDIVAGAIPELFANAERQLAAL